MRARFIHHRSSEYPFARREQGRRPDESVCASDVLRELCMNIARTEDVGWCLPQPVLFVCVRSRDVMHEGGNVGDCVGQSQRYDGVG
jgi:hypothetical protein